ncbi:pilin [Acinetobacter sp. 3657]|uniref:pilin n=1 Tax=Acinetobacter sp. 3657 TaxID=2817764 RepID=UPI00285B3A65|nr:type IV pilus assembly protein PilA [Prolinoborus sp. 3657]
MKRQNGFTLIEISVVVAIVGILAVAAVPAYQEYIARSQVTEAFSMASFYKSEMANVYAEQGRCPTLNDFSLDNTGAIRTRYLNAVVISSYTGANCAFTLRFTNTGISSFLQNKQIQIAMTSGAGGVKWECISSNIPQRFLPKACQGI